MGGIRGDLGRYRAAARTARRCGAPSSSLISPYISLYLPHVSPHLPNISPHPAHISLHLPSSRRTEQPSASDPAARIAAVSQGAPNAGPRSCANEVGTGRPYHSPRSVRGARSASCARVSRMCGGSGGGSGRALARAWARPPDGSPPSAAAATARPPAALSALASAVARLCRCVRLATPRRLSAARNAGRPPARSAAAWPG